MHKTVFKYRINELLNKFSVSEYKKAMLLIPQLLNVSQKTLNNYRNIKIDDLQDIPHEKVVILEKLFGLEPGDLQNFIYVIEPLHNMNFENQLQPLRVKASKNKHVPK